MYENSDIIFLNIHFKGQYCLQKFSFVIMYCTVCIYFRSGFEPLRPRAGPGRGGKNCICSNKKYKNRLLKKTEPNYKPRRNLYDPVDDGLVFVKCSLVKKKKYIYIYIDITIY